MIKQKNERIRIPGEFWGYVGLGILLFLTLTGIAFIVWARGGVC